MTKAEAIALRRRYLTIVVGRPISLDVQDILIEDIKIGKTSEGAYEVVVVAPRNAESKYVYKPLYEYLKENKLLEGKD